MRTTDRSLCYCLFLLSFIASAAFTFANDADAADPNNVDNTSHSSIVHIAGRRHLTLIDTSDELPPLFPFQLQDYLGFGVAVLGLLFAAGGGIGGGGILVPVYILLLDFPVKNAIPLASVTVFGGAVANNLLNAKKIHPDHPHRSVIDWELIIQLEPMAILGALIGVMVNNVLSGLVLVILMVILLTATSYETLTKANQLHRKECEELRKKEAAAIPVGETTKLMIVDDDGLEENTTRSASTRNLQRQETGLEARKALSRASFWAGTKLTVLFAVVTALNLLTVEGGPGVAIGLEVCGTTCYWSVQVTIVVVILSFAIYSRSDLLSRIQEDKPVPSDIEWNETNTITYPCYFVVAGLVAGLFGVGGGILKGPLMLALGVHPAVASATSACMILFTSSTSTVSYMVFDLLVPDYAVFCLILGFVSTVVGQMGMSLLLQRYKKNSYIAYCIGGVVAVSTVAMVIESVIAMMEH